eukprot:2160430-Pyramimonas_sp.AAC.1
MLRVWRCEDGCGSKPVVQLTTTNFDETETAAAIEGMTVIMKKLMKGELDKDGAELEKKKFVKPHTKTSKKPAASKEMKRPAAAKVDDDDSSNNGTPEAAEECPPPQAISGQLDGE